MSLKCWSQLLMRIRTIPCTDQGVSVSSIVSHSKRLIPNLISQDECAYKTKRLAASISRCLVGSTPLSNWPARTSLKDIIIDSGRDLFRFLLCIKRTRQSPPKVVEDMYFHFGLSRSILRPVGHRFEYLPQRSQQLFARLLYLAPRADFNDISVSPYLSHLGAWNVGGPARI